MGFRSCGDDAVERIAVWKIEFEGDAGDFGIDRNHAETFGHLGKQGVNAVRVLDPPFGAEIGDLQKNNVGDNEIRPLGVGDQAPCL